MSTGVTTLGGWIPLVNLDKGSTIPLCFVLQLAGKFTPTHIANTLSKGVVLDHVLDLQTLDADHLVLVNNAGRELMLIVSTPISYLGVCLSNLETSLGAVLGALFLLGMSSLSLGKLLLILAEVPWIAHMLTVTRDDHTLQAKVKPYLLGDDGKRCNILFYQDGNEVATCGILGHCHSGGLSIFRKRATPDNIQGGIHLGKRERVSIPLEGSTYVSSGLLPLLAMKRGVLSPSFKEVEKRLVEMTKRLLQGNRSNLIQPCVLRLLFQFGETSGSLSVVDALLLLVVGISTQAQRPIVDETRTAKGASKSLLLL